MITVQAEILFRFQREAEAHRILMAIADLVMPEVDGSVAAQTTQEPGEPEPWQHPHMEGQQ